MHATRFNGFSMIHKALRSMLYDAANSLQSTHFADVAAMTPVLEKIEVILELFDDHADHEDNLVMPVVKAFDGALVNSFEAEHVTDRNLGATLNKSIAGYKAAATDTERLELGHRVFYAFNEFIAFNLQHMNREETKLNEVMWAHHTDADIMGINQKIAASVTPDKAVINIGWMMRSCNLPEIIGFLKGIKANAPEPLFNMLMGLAQKELPAQRLAVVEQALSEAAVS